MYILHTDDQLIILNKPAGLPVLPDGWSRDAPYLVKMLEEQYGRIWIVHRLDKLTSGVMVFARTAPAHRDLNIQFEKHEVIKLYHALATGLPAWEEKTARHPLRVNVGHRHRTVVDDRRGKAAETRFKVLKRCPAEVLLEAQPMTGRTHQIRVHAMLLGHALIGDVLYGAPETDLIARPALHAWSLSFRDPLTGEGITFTAPYPEDFTTALLRINV
jgi:RluA family pseudouridine synthase